MHSHTLPQILGAPVNWATLETNQRSSIAIEKTLDSFQNNVWPLFKQVGAHLSARWSNCKKLIQSGELNKLIDNVHENGILEIPESSLLHQHARAAKLGGDALRAVSSILLVELCGGNSARYWESVTKIQQDLNESNYLSSEKRHIFLDATSRLQELIEELREALYGENGINKNVNSVCNSFDQLSFAIKEQRHQATIEGLDNKFHKIMNAMTIVAGFYEALTTFAADFHKELADLKQDLQGTMDYYRRVDSRGEKIIEDDLEVTLAAAVENAKNLFAHDQEGLTRKTLTAMSDYKDFVSRGVRKTRELLKKDNVLGLLLAAASTDLVGGPVVAIDFTLDQLQEVFNGHMAIHASEDNLVNLELDIEVEVGERVQRIDVFHRAMLGWVFDNLILNGIQAIKSYPETSTGNSIIVKAKAYNELLQFEVVTGGVNVSDEMLARIQQVIDHPERAKAKAGLTQGGNGLPNVTRWLTHRSCLHGSKPRLTNSPAGFAVSFELDWHRLVVPRLN